MRRSESSSGTGRRFVSRPAARHRAGDISRATEQRLLKHDPTWPRPRQISPGKSAYDEAELDAWLETRPERKGGASE
jgi:predicted DNA-binding transcriptional regulator AlpA